MLGRHRPGSEGNLASDLENKDDAVTTAAQDTGRGSPQETAKPEGKPEGGRRAKSAEKAAAADKAAAEPKPPRSQAAAAGSRAPRRGEPPVASR